MKKMIIADSGSTKTDWLILPANVVVNTRGINPIHETDEMIARVINTELLPHLSGDDISEIHFYGAGCTPAEQPRMQKLLASVFTSATTIDVEGDLLAAARALLQHSEGIACILGTGSNSCLYDGQRITANIPPLGYILGDEGSGAVLGKRFINAIFKGALPERYRSAWLRYVGMTYQQVISRIYSEPMANRFLASCAGYIATVASCAEIHQLILNNFDDFFKQNICRYHTQITSVSAIGGIAWQFRDILEEAARLNGFTVDRVEKSPLRGLAEYHGQVFS